MNLDDAARWMQGYVRAWRSNDPSDVIALFTEDAVFRTTPSSAPWIGAEAIARKWIEIGDEPGTWTFDYEPVAVAGDLAVVRARTDYESDPPGSYENLFVFRLDPEGRAVEFTEWYEKVQQQP